MGASAQNTGTPIITSRMVPPPIAKLKKLEADAKKKQAEQKKDPAPKK